MGTQRVQIFVRLRLSLDFEMGSKNAEFDADFKSVEKSVKKLIIKIVNKKYLKKNFWGHFSTFCKL
jgi:hypothetical protein